jgi:hypothetical protein
VFLRPEIERDARQFVDQRVRKPVPGEVGGLDVGVASVATLDAHVRKLFGSINRKFVLVFLSARGTDDATKLPFTEAETAKQIAAGAIAQLAQDAEGWLTIAKWAQGAGVAFELQSCVGADRFGVRLEKALGQKILRLGGRPVTVRPGVVEQVRP